ncbi:MAG TPA: hypothetical protein VGM77_05675 [Gemmatimonadales bacterium]
MTETFPAIIHPFLSIARRRPPSHLAKASFSGTEAMSDRLLEIARQERVAAADTVERLLPATAPVSVYLYQPTSAEGLRPESPGVLWDIGPLPERAAPVPRDLLYQCAEAGRTGSFLQSAVECTRRVPQTTRIDAAAARSYRAFNGNADARCAQIAIEQARHGFASRVLDGPPTGYFIHHLALAPSVQSFTALTSARLPVLGTIFTVTEEAAPLERREYSNLVDYAIFLAGELLEVRAEQLLGHGHVTSVFEGSALEALLDAPTSDASVQLAIKLLFAHHWFFAYDPVACALLDRLSGDAESLYTAHGWTSPRSAPDGGRSSAELHRLVVDDITTLVGHVCWYRLGREFRPRPGAVRESVRAALNTALLLLCGVRTESCGYGGVRRGEQGVFLGPPPALALHDPDESLLAPVFPAAGVRHLLRGAHGGETPLERFGASHAVCGPGDTGGGTRTHLKPMRYVEAFGHGGVPRFSARMHDGMRDRTRWVCSYAIGRLAACALLDREAGRA